MLEIIRIVSLVTVEPMRIVIGFLSSPLKLFRITLDTNIGATLALAFWAAAFNRHVASIQSEGISMFFHDVRDSPRFFSVVTQPFVGELITLLNITVLLILAIPMLRIWSRSWAEALNDKNAIHLLLILFGLSFFLRGTVQVPAALVVEMSETINQSTFRFLRISATLGGIVQLTMLFIVVANLRKLKSKISTARAFSDHSQSYPAAAK